jgi:hypothetical protein
MNISPGEIFIPCAEDMGKRHDYRSLQQLLQLTRENGYTDNKLHDDIIESCVRQTGSDVEQVIKIKLYFLIKHFLYTRVENKIH